MEKIEKMTVSNQNFNAENHVRWVFIGEQTCLQQLVLENGFAIDSMTFDRSKLV